VVFWACFWFVCPETSILSLLQSIGLGIVLWGGEISKLAKYQIHHRRSYRYSSLRSSSSSRPHGYGGLCSNRSNNGDSLAARRRVLRHWGWSKLHLGSYGRLGFPGRALFFETSARYPISVLFSENFYRRLERSDFCSSAF